MSTRALTCIYFNDTALVCLAIHFDGEPTAFGLNLAKFVKNTPLLDDSLDGIEIFAEKLKNYCSANTSIEQVFSRWEGVPFDPSEVLTTPAERVYNIRYDSDEPVSMEVLDSKGEQIFAGTPEAIISKYQGR